MGSLPAWIFAIGISPEGTSERGVSVSNLQRATENPCNFAVRNSGTNLAQSWRYESYVPLYSRTHFSVIIVFIIHARQTFGPTERSSGTLSSVCNLRPRILAMFGDLAAHYGWFGQSHHRRRINSASSFGTTSRPRRQRYLQGV